MATVIPFKPSRDVVLELLDEWDAHKRKLTFQRFISERMPLFFGPLSSNVSLFEKIKNAERQLDVRFTIVKTSTAWTGTLILFDEIYNCPQFGMEDDLRLFLILLHLKILSTKKPA